MNKKQERDLEMINYHVSHFQMDADKMAIKLIEQKRAFNAISVFQSMCDFNLSWLYHVSPGVFIHIETIVFLADNINKFKRKVSIEEIVKFDCILELNEIKDFKHFKTMLNKNKITSSN